MVPYTQSAEQTLQAQQSDIATGLSASQVKERLEKHGLNTLQEKAPKTLFQRFLAQFRDVLIIILLISAAISLGVNIFSEEGEGFFEPILILVIVVLNACVGVFQENKAEKALDALKKMSSPQARVIRGGEEQLVDTDQLVPGDIVRLEAGDFVPADGRIIRSANLKVDEAALTGESLPVEKDAAAIVEESAPLGDRINMVYNGCSVTYGTGMMVVTATGMATEMGKIASLLNAEEGEQTPLQLKLAQLGRILGFICLGACAIVFAVGLMDGMKPLDVFMVAVSLAVSAIPEGLPAIVTVVLSLGVQRMVEHNAIVRSLPAVETLGSASVICSDKTGTLTQNRMTLVRAWVPGMTEPEVITADNSAEVKKLLLHGALCCDGSVVFLEDGEKHLGDPTETSIVLAAHRNGMPKEDINRDYPRVSELPFDSDRKMMTTVNLFDGKPVAIVKGAFDQIAVRCIAGDVEEGRKVNQAMGEAALRVITVAYKELDSVPENPTSETLESGLTLLGLVGMIDPPREEVKDAVALCREAGIKPVMITGDHVVTASAIAREIGILTDGDEAVTGADVDAMSDEELERRVRNIAVYARVTPENKIRIVKMWQKVGEVAAMTGDGVNDAPALKAADIGCAMGITGTDVAKGAATMTLTDDNFATIVEAVRQGRGIYDNIRKVVGYLIGTNIGEILTVFFAMMFWRESPLLSMQLLWLNLLTDSLPAIALGMEPVDAEIMKRKPKKRDESIFSEGLGVRVALQGLLFGVLSLAGYWLGRQATGTVAGGQTLCFLTLAMSEVVQSYNTRSTHSLFKGNPFSNRMLNLAAVVSIVMTAVVLFTPLAGPFGLVMLPAKYYLYGVGLALLSVPFMEISKCVGFIRHEKHN
ncbi:MAG: calcium-translocating P-type ATPase, PMCA-type [Oscillospiraceae bacterium]|nr:calcium-translocating P-type ATPase, PMCA-type [Oscillospiraceae bacterium]